MNRETLNNESPLDKQIREMFAASLPLGWLPPTPEAVEAESLPNTGVEAVRKRVPNSTDVPGSSSGPVTGSPVPATPQGDAAYLECKQCGIRYHVSLVVGSAGGEPRECGECGLKRMRKLSHQFHQCMHEVAELRLPGEHWPEMVAGVTQLLNTRIDDMQTMWKLCEWSAKDRRLV